MSSRFSDRITNWLRGTSKPNWCSIHHRYYNAGVFKDCPDCLKESGPFFPSHAHIQIKHASPNDAHTLANLGRATFIETFAKDNRKEDMDLYVAETFSTEKQLAEIRDPNRIIEIAWQGTVATGYLHLMKGTPDPSVTGAKPIELLRLYVASPWHGKGVGAALIQRAIAVSHEQGFQTLWLGVWERNFRAQAFYKKYRFTTVGRHIFRLGTDNQIDLIMTRPIMNVEFPNSVCTSWRAREH